MTPVGKKETFNSVLLLTHLWRPSLGVNKRDQMSLLNKRTRRRVNMQFLLYHIGGVRVDLATVFYRTFAFHFSLNSFVLTVYMKIICNC